MSRRSRPWLLCSVLAALLGGGTVAILWLRAPSQPGATGSPTSVPELALPSVANPTPAAAASLDLTLQTASVDAINSRRSPTDALFRLAEDPSILVLDFAKLHTQARMLNRVAALVEKADMPRDRIVGGS